MIVRSCEKCQKSFEIRASEINRGNGRFCSRSCSASRKKPKSSVLNYECDWCGTKFHRGESKRQNSKSGLYFCSRACKETAQSQGGSDFNAIKPDHYGTGYTKDYYRKLVANQLTKGCERCGWNQYPILHVHHRDRNRLNNSLSNLEVLCPNCHLSEHYLANDGPFSGNMPSH